MITRRKILKHAFAAAATGIFAPMINRGRFNLFAHSAQEYSDRAVRLVTESLVIDMLNQFKNYFKAPADELEKWLTKPGAFTEEEVKKYRDSGINVFALGRGPRTYEEGQAFFARWNGLIAGYSQWLMRIDSVAGLDLVKKNNKVGIILSLQRSEHFRTPDDVDIFWGLGQRISQLTHNETNLIGSSFLETKDRGLTDFGRRIIERMNTLGMGIDLSHCGDQTTLDALEVSKQPVLFTHASCRTLVPNSLRCKTDEMIRKMAMKGGVMGIPYVRFMIRGKEPVTIEHLLDHYDYVAKLVGIEHVGIGGDFALDTDDQYLAESKEFALKMAALDNGGRYGIHLSDTGLVGIEGVNHPKRVFDLTEGLIRRKYSDDNIKLILGNNFKRALSTIWSV